MSKRDRAARAKQDAEGVADSASDELETADTDGADASDKALDGKGEAADDSSSDKALRPTGKRSGGRRSSATATDTTDGDTDSEGGSAVAVKERKKKASPAENRNPIVRIWVFLQQVVAELKKVIWPTRREMITYTIVVLVFVVIMTAFIFGIDIAFAKGVLWLFG